MQMIMIYLLLGALYKLSYVRVAQPIPFNGLWVQNPTKSKMKEENTEKFGILCVCR